MAWIAPKTDWTSPDGVTYNDLNRIEGNLEALVGVTNKSTIERKAVDIPIDTRSVEITRSNGIVDSIVIKDPADASTVATASITRVNGQITSLSTVVGGKTLTYTIARVDGAITGVTKEVV